MTRYDTVNSPVGELLLVGDGAALTGLYLPGHKRGRVVGPDWVPDRAAFRDARAQLAAYFARELTAFDLALAPVGTAFQHRVWAALREIPYGETASYGELAQRIGSPGAARAVGLANGRNPISIVVPCHRVIGARGLLTGYAGGVDAKRTLLALEAARVEGQVRAASSAS